MTVIYDGNISETCKIKVCCISPASRTVALANRLKPVTTIYWLSVTSVTFILPTQNVYFILGFSQPKLLNFSKRSCGLVLVAMMEYVFCEAGTDFL